MSDDRPDLRAPIVLDYELADVVVADTPARLKALGHPLRSLLVDLVLERAMTVTELADLVGKPRGSVAHHVDVLVQAGMLQVVRTRRVRALEERYYGRTGRTIVFPDQAHDTDDLPFAAEVRREIDLHAPTSTAGGFTYRHARIPAERAAEFTERVMELALEFTLLPRGGDVEYGFYVGVFPTNRLPGRGESGGADPAASDRAPSKRAPSKRAPSPRMNADPAPSSRRRSSRAASPRTTEGEPPKRRTASMRQSNQEQPSVRATRTRKERS